MANLRADNLTGTGGRNAIDGSVFFDGSRSYLTMVSGEIISGTGFGTNDFTIEFWINQGVNASNYTGIFNLKASTTTDRFQVAFQSSTIQVYTDTSTWRDTGYAPVSGQWEHIAFVRNYSGNTLKMYANGVEKWSVSNTRDYDEAFETFIGLHSSAYGYLQGYISNLRVLNGTALYTTNYFTPPTEKLTAVENTVLLCCQDSDDPTAEALGKEIIGFGGVYQGKRYSNIATNGDLETGDTTGWTNGGCSTFEVSTDVVHSGTYSLHCISDGNGDHVYTTVSVNTGLRYKVSAYINCVGPAGTSAKAKMKIGTSAANSTNYESQTANVGAGWVYVEWIGLPAASTLYITFNESSANNVNDWYVDDLKVELWYPEEGENILPNPNFLTGATGWSFSSTPSGEYTISSNRLNVADNSRTSDAFATVQLFSTSYKEGRYKVTIDYVLTSDDFDIGIGNNRIFGVAGGGTFSGEGNSASVTYEIEAGNGNSSLRLIANQHCVGYFNSITCSRVAEPKRINPTPPYGIDAGVVFEGDTKVNSQGYMYFPTGSTEERGRSSRGIWAGGYKAPWALADNVNSLEYFNIQTTGNAVDFGDRSVIQNQGLATVASSTRGVMMGGRAYNHPSPGQVTVTDTIDYVTIATIGDAIDFGNLTHGAGYIHAAGSNSTRGVLFRSSDGNMEYITIATTGDSVDTGSDGTVGRNTFSGSASQTRAFWAGGANPSGGAAIGSIDYLEIASLGVPQDFGDLTFTGHNQAASSNTRGIIFTGGFPTATSNTINYITIASTGNAIDFGDTLNTMGGHSAGSGCSNGLRAVRCGGYTAPNTSQNWIDYVSIQSTGNSIDFGDLITIRHGGSGFSDSHGGLS